MTTEIAVLNRLGVALAADSAVTISGGGTTKVFESADKLFELSCRHPVGLMLNGNMDCFGVPWELLIKDYREHNSGSENKPIEIWAKEFVEFVESRADVGTDTSRNYVFLVAATELAYLKNDIRDRLWISRRKSIDDAVMQSMSGAVAERRAELQTFLVAGSLSEITDEEIITEYGDALRKIISEKLEPFSVSAEMEQDIFHLIIDALRALIPNDFSTGLIIAGYGNGDNYPAVMSIDIHGYVKGRLKYSEIKDMARIRRPERGHAVSFAQTDVIERLLSGADPRFIDKTAEFISTTCDEIAPLIAELRLPERSSDKRKKSETEKIRAILSIIEEKYVNDTSKSFKNEFRDEFERMIALMPKLELIELAEALISITAIERKATSDEGTVGGPIDVAFITKHEGFVWIKRKLYFKQSLNPRYFWRKYNIDSMGGSE